MTVEAQSSTADLEEAREKLIHSFAPLPDDLLDDANVVGTWSIHECLAHILAWDEWGEKARGAFERGEEAVTPDDEAINAAVNERRRHSSGADAQRRLRAGRLPIVSWLAAMSDAERSQRRYVLDRRRISANDFVDGFIEHDLEHACEIRAWRKTRNTAWCWSTPWG